MAGSVPPPEQDYEVLPGTSEAMIRMAMIHIMVRRWNRRVKIT